MKRIVSSVLVLVLVAVTIGLPVYRHTCYVFDRSEVSLITQKQCCDPGESKSEAAIDFQCCSLEHFDTALDYETLTTKSVELAGLFMLETKISNIELLPVVERSKSLPVLRAPPLANRTILNKTQQYLI